VVTFSSTEVRNRLGKPDHVARGETIVITRRGKIVARIVPEAQGSLETVRQAVENMRVRRREMA
jgi:antitoxin (DNA-binding transcriptional repressor) of toxin-antitoxin stability system